MTKIREKVIELEKAIKRQSPLIADNLAFPMSAEELEYLYKQIGRDYIMTLMFPRLTLGGKMSLNMKWINDATISTQD